MEDNDDSWYQKIAKAGYLGTKAKVSATYGHPAWGSGNESEDVVTTALRKVRDADRKRDEQSGA